MPSNILAHYGGLGAQIIAGLKVPAKVLIPTEARTPVVVVGPQGLEREGLVEVLQQNGYYVLCSAGDNSDLRLECKPDLVILSEFGQKQIATGVIPFLKSRFPKARIVVLTDETSSSTPRYLMEMGIQACLSRSTEPVALIKSLNVVMGGNIVISIEAALQLNNGAVSLRKPPIMRLTNIAENSSPLLTELSIREIDILSFLSAGHSNKSIGRALNISEATVKIHVKSVLRKINVRNRTQAAVWVSRFGVPKAVSRRHGRHQQTPAESS